MKGKGAWNKVWSLTSIFFSHLKIVSDEIYILFFFLFKILMIALYATKNPMITLRKCWNVAEIELDRQLSNHLINRLIFYVFISTYHSIYDAFVVHYSWVQAKSIHSIKHWLINLWLIRLMIKKIQLRIGYHMVPILYTFNQFLLLLLPPLFNCILLLYLPNRCSLYNSWGWYIFSNLYLKTEKAQM